jgi:trigger factor
MSARTLRRAREQREAGKKGRGRVQGRAEREIDIPDLMVDSQAEQLLENLANNLRSQGMDFATYLQYTGQNYEQARGSMKPQAEQQIRTRLTLEAVAEAENLEVSDEEVDTEIETMAKNYGIELDRMKEIIAGEERENLRSDLRSARRQTSLARTR